MWLIRTVTILQHISFNPHTHAGCDGLIVIVDSIKEVSIHTPTQGVTLWKTKSLMHKLFQSTHPRRVWLCVSWAADIRSAFQSTHPRRVWLKLFSFPREAGVSIHTPTQGVTHTEYKTSMAQQFQSTHPRRVWQHEPLIHQRKHLFQSTHPRRVWHHNYN